MACRITRAVLLAALAVALLVPPAQAAFPGANGKIAFSSNRDDANPNSCGLRCNYEIYTINADGTGTTRLTNNPLQDSDPVWSQDGQKIAFTRTDPATGAEAIWVMNANGSGQVSLGEGLGPAWSPDGQKLAFTTDFDPGCTCTAVVTVNGDGSGRTAILSVSSDAGPVEDADWSADGEWIAFRWLRFDLDGRQHIYKVRPDGTVAGPLTGSLNSDEAWPTWSPSADDLGYFSVDNETELFGIFSLDRGFISTFGVRPAWSPDARTFAVDSFGDIHTWNLATPEEPTPVTNHPADDCCPAWQPVVNLGLDPYPRPGGATPMRVALIPAYSQCTSGLQNSNHVAPLALDSCAPPTPFSQLLTTSTTGLGSGFARLVALPGVIATPEDEADFRIEANAIDVRNASDGSDYTGQLLLELGTRITDKRSGFGGVPATVADAALSFPLSCTATATAAGGECSLSTTADTVLPSLVIERKRTVLSLRSLTVRDAGADGSVNEAGCPLACGTGDEQTFLDQGVFAP
jgi:WD40-like Beta Propeller Repeat